MGIIGAVKVRGYCTVWQTQVSALLTHPNTSHVRVHRGGITSADLECYTVPRIGLVSRNLQRVSVNFVQLHGIICGIVHKLTGMWPVSAPLRK